MVNFGIKAFLAVMFVVVLILGCTQTTKSTVYEKYDKFVIDQLEPDKTAYISRLIANMEGADDFAKGDIYFVLWRLNQIDICPYIKFYKSALNSSNCEERGVIYETLASLSEHCNLNRTEYINLAKTEWIKCNMSWRNDVLDKTAKYREYNIQNVTVTPNSSKLRIGTSYIKIDSDSVIGVQSERVIRDWLSGQIKQSPFTTPTLNNIYNTFYEKLSYDYKELRPDIGWHEGGRLTNILNSSDAKVIALSGTIVKKINDIWFAPDETGTFMFEVLSDKIENYPTTRFLYEDLAVMTDTHGISSIVEQALRDNATVVIGCCDSEGKIKAAHYLAEKGVNVYCPTDMNLPGLIGVQTNGVIVGSAPIKQYKDYVIIGNQSIVIDLNEKIIAETTEQTAGLRYYETPYVYFTSLENVLSIKLNLTKVEVNDTGQSERLVNEAEKQNSHLIGARVFNYADYEPLYNWLKSDKQNRVVLFHSIPYPYGYLLFNEFPEQTSFGDIKLVFE
jgi:hypothetical protein